MLFTALILALTNCGKDFSDYYSYSVPEFIDDGLNTGGLDDVGLDSQRIARAIGRIYANKYDQVHSFLIYKNGTLVLEEYMEGNKYAWERNQGFFRPAGGVDRKSLSCQHSVGNTGCRYSSCPRIGDRLKNIILWMAEPSANPHGVILVAQLIPVQTPVLLAGVACRAFQGLVGRSHHVVDGPVRGGFHESIIP